jgi:hypothetical protein
VTAQPRDYVESVRERLARAGFREESPPDGASLKARRRQVKLSRFGIAETVVVISNRVPQGDAEKLRSFGGAALRSAVVGKSRVPRGFGSSVVVYPVLLVETISDGLTDFVEHYVPKHWSIMEFPIVVEPAARTFLYRTKTAIWGAAYYRKTRREAEELLAPAAAP